MTEMVFWDTSRGEDGDPLAQIYDDAVPRPGDAIAWQLGADVPGGPSMHFGKVQSVSWILQIGKRPASYLRADVSLTEKGGTMSERIEPYEPLADDHHLANVARELLALDALQPEEDMLLHAAAVLSGGLDWALARLEEVSHDSDV